MSPGDGEGKGPTRLQSRVPVQLRIVFQAVGEVLEAFSTNLGAGGMLLISNREVAEGARLRLRFKLPGVANEFNTGAEVAWRRVDGSGFGLRFIDLADEEQQQIARFVTERWSEMARTALVASASPAVHAGLGAPLAQRGQRILSATDVLTAERLLDDLAGIGVVLIDLRLPPLDGLHVLRSLRARPALLARQVPVIILVEGNVSPADMDRMRAEGATAVLSYGRPSDWLKLADAAMQLAGKPVAQ
jgi:uncharacterized protein (TIGR02266 family)